VSLTGDTIVEPATPPDQSAAETARLSRYAADIQKQLPKTNTQQITRLENTARQAELTSTRDELQRLERSGYNVDRELSRVESEISRLATPQFPLTEPSFEPEFEPGTLPPAGEPEIVVPRAPEFEPFPEVEVAPPGRAPQIDIDVTPGTRPQPRPGTRPDQRPGERPVEEPSPTVTPSTRPGTETAPTTRPQEEGAIETAPSTRPDRDLAPRTDTKRPDRTRPDGRRPITTPPIDIDELFTDEEILNLIRESFGEDYLEETQIEEPATVDTNFPATVDIEMAGAQRRPDVRKSLSSRQVGQGAAAIVGDKDPTFGGDPNVQQDVWNVRSLRLRKALGL
jgi:hypothetical protein